MINSDYTVRFGFGIFEIPLIYAIFTRSGSFKVEQIPYILHLLEYNLLTIFLSSRPELQTGTNVIEVHYKTYLLILSTENRQDTVPLDFSFLKSFPSNSEIARRKKNLIL